MGSLLLGALASACGGDPAALACSEDSECVRAGATGACIAGGTCAFTDSACATGWRVDSAAAVNAGACLYGEGFDDAAWIPEARRDAALVRGGVALNELASPVDAPTPIDAVVVLATRPLLGFDPAGFYVQGTPDSRAWLVAIDPATLSPSPRAGDVVRFVATESTLPFDQRNITAIAPGSWQVYSGWTEPLEPYVRRLPETGMVDHLSFLNENESRLFTGRIRLGRGDATHPYGTWNSAGPGHHYLSMDVPAFYNADTGEETVEAQTELRFPEEQAFEAARELGVREGCTVEFGPVPMWRWNAFIEFNILDLETDLEVIECEPDVVRTPLALTETMLADDPDTAPREMWLELLATEAVDLATCEISGLGTGTAIPLATRSTMLAAGDRVVVVDSSGLTLPTTYTRGAETITPTYIEVPDLSWVRTIVWDDGVCGEGYLFVSCGGTVIDRIAGQGCRGWEPPNVAMAAPPTVERTLNRSFVAFCEQTTMFEATRSDRSTVMMRGTPGAPNDACF
jgi:hypothetical protein